MEYVDKKYQAMLMARDAAKIDLESAIRGVLSGAEENERKLNEQIVSLRHGFLMALALTEKGAKIDKHGHLEAKIAEILTAFPTGTIAEKDFLARKGSETK